MIFMDQSCKSQVHCSSVAMDKEQITQELESLKPAWQLDLQQPNKISREFSFKNFSEALAFVNQVASIAEELNHHPDIILKWAYVKVEYWTHDAQGLTASDFAAAQKINSLL